MQIKERCLTETLPLRKGKGDLKGFQTNFENYFYNYLSLSDTCQLESA